MAYTLKASGLATNLISCIAVDSDGTVKEFVSGTGAVISTYSQTSNSGNWKGTAFKYFATRIGGGVNNLLYDGITYTAGPTLACGNGHTGWALFVVAEAATGAGGAAEIMEVLTSGGAWVDRAGTSSVPRIRAASTTQATGTTAWPTDGTSFSCGYSQVRNGATRIWFAIESVNAVSEATALEADVTSGDDGNDTTLVGFGGWSGQSSSPVSPYLVAYFNRPLTAAEQRTLHDDWFATLFDTGGGGGATLTCRLALLGVGM